MGFPLKNKQNKKRQSTIAIFNMLDTCWYKNYNDFVKEKNMKHKSLIGCLTSALLFAITGCNFSSNTNPTTSTSSNDGTFKYVGNSVYPIDTTISGDLVIPESFNGERITKIPRLAFKNCTKINSITIPDSIETIELGAFSGCTSLKSVTLPFIGQSRSDTSRYSGVLGYIFGDWKYEEATKANGFFIPNTLAKVTVTDASILAEQAFYQCSMLDDILLNEEIIAIGAHAFDGCSSISTINLPNITKVPKYCFTGCTSLESVNVSEKITEVGEYAFSGCINLIRINNSQDGYYSLPKTINEIGKNAFMQCLKIDQIELPFIGKNRKESTALGQFGYVFGDISYEGSQKVEALAGHYYIPKKIRVVYITDAELVGQWAFHGCSMIEYLFVNKEAQNNVHGSAFLGCVEPIWF